MTRLLPGTGATEAGAMYRPVVLRNLWRTHRPPAADIGIAAAFAVVGQLVTWGRFDDPAAFVGSRPLNAVLNLVFMAAIAWRRTAPLAAVCWAVGIYFLTHPVLPHDVTFIATAIPLVFLTASAGYYAPRKHALAALGAALAAVVVVAVEHPWLGSWDFLAWNATVMSVPWLLARGLRQREEQAASLAGLLVSERASKEAALRQAATAERSHIARELHDIVAHSVSVMMLQIGAARMQLQSGADGVEAPLLEAETAGRQTLEDLRRLLGVLRADAATDGRAATGPEPPQPGLPQLESLLAPSRAAGLDVAVEFVGRPVELPAALDLTAYRIVQEALTNSLKHSGAGQVTVRIEYTPTAVVIDVVDDGVPVASSSDAGLGLVGLRERVAVFGGQVTAGPDEGGGWRVSAELPGPALDVRRRSVTALPNS